MPSNLINRTDNIVFLMSGTDYHARDWVESAKINYPEKNIYIITDILRSEGNDCVISDNVIVKNLIILDAILLKKQSNIGNIWRNIVKLLLLPLQSIVLRYILSGINSPLIHANSMYYVWLAALSGKNFIATPQGSDILLKLDKSIIFRKLSSFALKRAKRVTVDSNLMAEKCLEITSIKPVIIQNGIDIKSIQEHIENNKESKISDNLISFRGITPLYCTLDIATEVIINDFKNYNLIYIYPFAQKEYLTKLNKLIRENDSVIGRVDKTIMYNYFGKALLSISIPISDSSPRSVYEAIFCGSPVAIRHNDYINNLPECMRNRLIIVDPASQGWLNKALITAKKIKSTPFTPTKEAVEMFDQRFAFFRLVKGL